ncbi:hypothetical protein [Methylobacterium variabile]|uniref:hypothetical protein n=1 Tax=Methylobacterium variabile TaxID=298794 RepID=UPI000ABB09CE|nr:hypothetical protein [Methylobacterium variabile]
MTPDAYRQYWALAIRDLQPDYAVTLAYNNHMRGYEVVLEKVAADLDHLHGFLDRRLYGAYFHQRPPARRTTYIGCVENKNNNLHVHLAWRVPEDNKKMFAQKIKEIWCSAPGKRTISVKPINDLMGWSSYTTKDLDPRDPDADRMVIVGRHART